MKIPEWAEGPLLFAFVILGGLFGGTLVVNLWIRFINYLPWPLP